MGSALSAYIWPAHQPNAADDAAADDHSGDTTIFNPAASRISITLDGRLYDLSERSEQDDDDDVESIEEAMDHSSDYDLVVPYRIGKHAQSSTPIPNITLGDELDILSDLEISAIDEPVFDDDDDDFLLPPLDTSHFGSTPSPRNSSVDEAAAATDGRSTPPHVSLVLLPFVDKKDDEMPLSVQAVISDGSKLTVHHQ